MPSVRFASLPLIVRLSSLLAPLLGWILFEELIIDRLGLDRYLPFYRYGHFCPYDLAAVAIVVVAWFRLNRSAPD